MTQTPESEWIGPRLRSDLPLSPGDWSMLTAWRARQRDSADLRALITAGIRAPGVMERLIADWPLDALDEPLAALLGKRLARSAGLHSSGMAGLARRPGLPAVYIDMLCTGARAHLDRFRGPLDASGRVPMVLADCMALWRDLAVAGNPLPEIDRQMLESAVVNAPDVGRSPLSRFRAMGDRREGPPWEREVYLALASMFARMPWATDDSLDQALHRAAATQHMTASATVGALLRHPALSVESCRRAVRDPVSGIAVRRVMAAHPPIHHDSECRSVLGESTDPDQLSWATVGASSATEFDGLWNRLIEISPEAAVRAAGRVEVRSPWLESRHLTPLLESKGAEIRLAALLVASTLPPGSPAPDGARPVR